MCSSIKENGWNVLLSSVGCWNKMKNVTKKIYLHTLYLYIYIYIWELIIEQRFPSATNFRMWIAFIKLDVPDKLAPEAN